MNKLLTIITFICFLVALPTASLAYRPEGTSTYKDYLIILIHGINGGAHHFNGQDYRDKDLRLQEYLEKDLGLDGHVYAYSFKDKNGSSKDSVEELCKRSTAHYIDENGNDRAMNGMSWLEKAKSDYKDWFRSKNGRDPLETEIPQKYIFITHSMGNMPARLYIYSKSLLNRDYYNDDVDKVVFIAPPFCGSDLAYAGLIPKQGLFAYEIWDQYNAFKKMWEDINSTESHLFWINPYNTYRVTKAMSMIAVNHPMLIDSMLAEFDLQLGGPGESPIKISNREWKYPNSLFEGSGYGALNPGLWELIPEYMMNTSFPGLMDAQLSDDTKEPDYSVVYGQGAPVLNMRDSLSGQITWGTLNSMVRTPNFQNDLFNKFQDNFKIFSDELDSEMIALISSKGFSDLSTSQAKFYSIINSNPVVSFTKDGDGAVPVESAKGIYEGKHTRALKTALFYSETYTCGLNDYLENEFPNEFEAVIAIYYLVYFTPALGGPAVAENMKPWLQWALAASFLDKVSLYAHDLQEQVSPHTNSILKNYAPITTALLDSYGILTIQDMLATQELESVASSEETKHYFTISNPAPGYYSIPIRSFATRSNTDMGVVGPIPTTIDGTREYVSQLLVTQKPERVVAKLNYLIPQKLKQFQYSFNFQAWQDVSNVDNFTGVVTFEGLHFAEGQNLLAVRTTNYAGIKYNQLIKVILNTITVA